MAVVNQGVLPVSSYTLLYNKRNSRGTDIRPCGANGCTNAKLDNATRCRDHVCRAVNDCQGIRVPMSTFCGAHKCAVAGCPGQRRVVDGGIPLATLMALDPSGNSLHLALGFGAYCAKHTCAQVDCSERAFKDGKFCATHTCRYKGCTNESSSKDYCSLHLCHHRHCTSEVVADGHFCVSHTCDVKDCRSERQGSGKYSEKCRLHEQCCSESGEDSSDDTDWWPSWDDRTDYGGSRQRNGRGRRRRTPGGGAGYPPVSDSPRECSSIQLTNNSSPLSVSHGRRFMMAYRNQLFCAYENTTGKSFSGIICTDTVLDTIYLVQ